MRKFKLITELCTILLTFCAEHKIRIWPERGTLLGLIRNDWIIPWDWDADFGLELKNLVFVQAFTHDNYLIEKVKDNYLIFRQKEDKETLVDLVFYETSPELKKSLFLGKPIYVPLDSREILTKLYGDWENFPDQVSSDLKFLQKPFNNFSLFKKEDGNYIESTDHKILIIILKEDLEKLISKGWSENQLKTMDLGTLIYLEESWLWGKIFVEKLKKGDTLAIPEGSLLF